MQALVKLMERIGGLALLGIVIVMAVTTVTRYLFSWPIPDADAISRMLLAVVVFWGFAAACNYREHIQLDLLTSLLPRRLRRVVLWLSDVIVMAEVCTATWMTFRRILDLRSTGETTYDLGLPQWPFYALAYLGLIAAAVVSVALVAGRGGLSQPRSEIDEALSHIDTAPAPLPPADRDPQP